uniref:Putative elongation factor 1 delta n=1 Tax=Graphocephala atropunctata TaxID=36148 RepID=Q1W2A4_9HEMI|nr:putative elongation factor 1 delta [Graphocephala atropunctata]
MEVALAQEKIWFDKYKYEEAEKAYFENLSKVSSNNAIMKNSLAEEVAKARQHIKSSLECMDGLAKMTSENIAVEFNNRLNSLESENSNLKKEVNGLTTMIKKLNERIATLEKSGGASSAKPVASAAAGSQKPASKPKVEDDDDGVDLFGSDSEEEDEDAKKIKEQRLAEYAARKSKKPVLIAKSNIILDVKPWDDETDMKKMEVEVRKVTTDGLIWGASKLVPLAYGIHKLQISCVVEDDKVSVDWLQEQLEAIEDYVQSVDIAAFNKV